ncbi:hypothetical protein [Hymenobacter properus]|uniref:Uncharacterized protein n=1 Tax=Hymenobacter properus TaxID=2791026 RepID=A0A931BF30_9BACT|nr:hypothetical protein [Hymenobacter properus]MBF9141293.1 hypothetical protein [Hymenobacter properus]MBR7720103.1 hypothetical protein [Microvirga sp. SRT04]
MHKTPTILLAASLLTIGLTFSGCKKDNEDIEIYSTVAGNYVGTEKCPTTPGAPYTISIYNQADTKNGKVFITNLYGIEETYEATVDGNHITVPTTPYQYTYQGTTYRGNIKADGTVNGNILKISYTLDGDDPENCTFEGDREFRGPTHQGPN